MRLKSYRVQNFRSVDDSGPVETDGVTALIGTNEAGKTNLLLPLWKLKPAKDGEIIATADFPRKRYADFRNLNDKPVFVSTIFAIPDDLAKTLSDKTGIPSSMFKEASIEKTLGGQVMVGFPSVTPDREIAVQTVAEILGAAKTELDAASPLKEEVEHKPAMMSAIERALDSIKGSTVVKAQNFGKMKEILDTAPGTDTPKSSLAPRFSRLKEDLAELANAISKPHPSSNADARKLVFDAVPSFVYYSNYGNLDSEIYLPHVIQNMTRKDLGAKEAAKARTLKVLFEFVGLKPDEILELGQDAKKTANADITPEEIEKVAQRKKERSILLQSASTKLTTEFREWWKQGAYRFRFEADGDHFRIWVSDDQRPEEVELEGRSTGLQWFLSFYLVFLVESRDSHQGCILLLDEPGLSLHPLAQQDLTAFFDGLSETNQILYTTHSPFMIDSDHLDRARKVYVADDGTSKLSADLQFQGTEKTRRAAGYTVWSALGIAVAESFLYGCKPIIVEGPSDQHYFTAVKQYLIKNGKLKPAKELVFPPAGGAKGVKAVASIVMAKDDALPMAMFDADGPGLQTIKQLKETLYAQDQGQVLCVTDFIKMADAETEDLFPVDMITRAVDGVFKTAEKSFADKKKRPTAIVPQIEAWAKENGIKLEVGWKVDVAKRVKQKLLDDYEVAADLVERWEALFKRFAETASTSASTE